MITANVVITGDKEFMAKLSRLDASISNFSAALTQIGRRLHGYYQDTVFNSMGGVYGTPWAKLAPSTIAQKTKHYRQYAAVPLMATGTMRDSFVETADEHTLTIGNDAPYFVYHQSTEPRTRLPRRQILGVTPEVKLIVQQIIKEDINKKIRAL